MQLLTLAKRGWLALVIATIAVYFFGIGSVPLIGPDEPRYAQVAREMFDRGDLITPTLTGRTWFEKPALLYWLAIAGYAVFGVSELGVRVGSALSGVLTILFAWLIARKVEKQMSGRADGLSFVVAAVTASTAGLIIFSHGASFDPILTTTVTAAICFFFHAESEHDPVRRRWLLVAFYATVGATLLAKGLVGPVIAVGVPASYWLVQKRRPGIVGLGLLWGPFVTLAVAAVWYGPVIARHGQQFLDEFFLQHHLARFTSNKYHHPQPFYFYVPIIGMLALPWTMFLVASLWRLPRTLREDNSPLSSLARLATLWLIVPVVFFSFSGSKLPGYVLPAVPAAAILASIAVFQYLKGDTNTGVNAMRATGILALSLLVAGIAFVAGLFGDANTLFSKACALAIIAPAAFAGPLAVIWPRRRMLCFVAISSAVFLTILLIIGCALGPFAAKQTVKPLIQQADAAGLNALPVAHLHVVERTSEFYAANRLIYDENGDPKKFEGAWQVFDEFRRRGGEGLVLVPTELAYQLNEQQGTESKAIAEAKTIADNGELALVYVRVN